MLSRADLAAGAVVCLVVLLAVAGATARRRAEARLAGVWAGDPLFLQEEGLSEFQFFVAPPSGGARSGYLIVADGERLAANAAVQLRFAPKPWAGLRLALWADAPLAGTLEIAAEEALPLPPRLEAQLGSTLVLRDAQRVRAVLRRDEAASAAALAAWKA
jgi:hypothetical protein